MFCLPGDLPMYQAHAFNVQSVYMGRFEYGDDIIQELQTFCLEKDIKAAWVHIIGALSKATISYYEQEGHKYVNKTLEREFEIVSCSGNISLKENKPFAHLHIVLSDTEYGTLAGHLMPGSTKLFAGEFVIMAFESADGPNPLIRVPDEKTGLALWK